MEEASLLNLLRLKAPPFPTASSALSNSFAWVSRVRNPLSVICIFGKLSKHTNTYDLMNRSEAIFNDSRQCADSRRQRLVFIMQHLYNPRLSRVHVRRRVRDERSAEVLLKLVIIVLKIISPPFRVWEKCKLNFNWFNEFENNSLQTHLELEIARPEHSIKISVLREFEFVDGS